MASDRPTPLPGTPAAVGLCDQRVGDSGGTCYLSQIAELVRVSALLKASPDFAGHPAGMPVASRLREKAAAILADGLPSPCHRCLPPSPPDLVSRILDAMEAAALVELSAATDGGRHVDQSPAPDPDQ